MLLPRSLTLVTDREELADLVTRCALSFDVNDRELFLSVWTTSDPSNVDATIAGVTTKGVEEIVSEMLRPCRTNGHAPLNRQYPCGYPRRWKNGADHLHDIGATFPSW